MVFLGDCQACQWGDHAGHDPHPQVPPEGMIGGWSCPCAGDCAERNQKPEPVLAVERSGDDVEFVRLVELIRHQG
jgi:hypothetical protein